MHARTLLSCSDSVKNAGNSQTSLDQGVESVPWFFSMAWSEQLGVVCKHFHTICRALILHWIVVLCCHGCLRPKNYSACIRRNVQRVYFPPCPRTQQLRHLMEVSEFVNKSSDSGNWGIKFPFKHEGFDWTEMPLTVSSLWKQQYWGCISKRVGHGLHFVKGTGSKMTWVVSPVTMPINYRSGTHIHCFVFPTSNMVQ